MEQPEPQTHTPPDRSSSGLSLSSGLSMTGPGPQDATKRRLLLIYIHGFGGSETTFSDMPVHVHSALAALLSESHVVYTRIYPRYKSKGEFQLAVDRFSGWLSPYESDDLDVILLGHSMGGIIAADIALLHKKKSEEPMHRILGIISYDTPYLGLHPHVVSTGLGNLFSKTDLVPEAQESPNAADFEQVYEDPTFNPPDPPPNYNPQWQDSDSSFMKSAKQFIQKKREQKRAHDEKGLLSIKRLTAPMAFAGGVNNYANLRRRYQRLRDLESAEDNAGRVRFINYYTSSTPRQKVKEEGNSKKNITSLIPGFGSSTSINQPRERVFSETASVSPSMTSSIDSSETLNGTKLRRFCLLPSSHWKYDDNRNWFPVTMEEMSELEAHMSMFLPNRPGYDYLVGDTVALVEQWIQHDLTRRLLKEQEEAT